MGKLSEVTRIGYIVTEASLSHLNEELHSYMILELEKRVKSIKKHNADELNDIKGKKGLFEIECEKDGN